MNPIQNVESERPKALGLRNSVTSAHDHSEQRLCTVLPHDARECNTAHGH